METMEAAASEVVIAEIKDRTSKRGGVVREGARLAHTIARIIPGAKKWAVNTEAYTVVKTFKIGDWAEVGGYNLTYTGRVRKITEKTITVVEYEDSAQPRTYRLSLYMFAWMNWDFDAEAVAKRNSEWMD